MQMNSMINKYRLAAEWEPQSAVLLSLPHPDTDWNYMLPQVHECYVRILRALIYCDASPVLLVPDKEYAKNSLPPDVLEGVRLIEAEYNDTWIRDYGPLTLRSTDESGQRQIRMADFGFNGWGLKFAADKDNLVTRSIFGPGSTAKFSVAYRDFLGYVLEGGSVESDGMGTLLTTSRCLCSLNRNGGLSKPQIEDILSKTLGINHFLWLDHGALQGDDTDSHIDTLARICPNDTILYTGCSDKADPQFKELSLMATELQKLRTPDGKAYKLVELPLPAPIYDKDDGHRLPATYANYLITDKAVLLPVYAQPDLDKTASEAVQSVYPDREIISIDCRPLIRQHGSLHCATMQLNK